MLSFFKSKQAKVPDFIQNQLKANFPEAKNIEWINTKDAYEALFYVSDTELIASYDAEGRLLNYKKNIWPNQLPDFLADKILGQGELMNAIEVFTTNDSFFELIFRDKQFNRKLVIVDKSGEIQSEKALS